jgi:uncharacterized protein involved in exopolysaccharide biosynthesis
VTRTSPPVATTGLSNEWRSDEATTNVEPPQSTPRVPYRWFAALAAAIVAVGAVAGLAGAFLLPATHAARAEILYPITEELPTGFLREDRNLTTQLVLLRSRAVLAPAAQAEGMPLPQLERQVTISLLDSSEVIRIEVRHESPSVAVRLVDHITEIYLDMAQATPESNALRYVESELADVEAALTQARQRLGELRGEQGPDGDQLSDQIDAVAAEIDDLRSRAQALRQERDEIQIIQRAAPIAELITEPYVLEDPVSPGPAVLGAAGALTGVVAAACVIALLMRRRIRG